MLLVAKTAPLETPGIDVNEHKLREWFSTELITREGTRGLVHQGSEADETGGLPNAAVKLLGHRPVLRRGGRVTTRRLAYTTQHAPISDWRHEGIDFEAVKSNKEKKRSGYF